VGLAICAPITSSIKGYPFEVVLPPDGKIAGAVLCDQLKSLDWRARRARRIQPAPIEVIDEATAKIRALIDPQAG
jgi:mRNA interferase MazF